MGLRRRSYLAENIKHRELPLGSEASMNMHANTIRTLEKSPKRPKNPTGYAKAIAAHRKALNLYRGLRPGPNLVKSIRAAKAAAKEAHIITREL